MKIPKDMRLPLLRMDARFEPETVDAENRTVELRWYTGAAIERFSVFDGPFRLSFSLDPKAIRMDRLQSGSAPLKGGHRDNSDLAGVFGVIEEAWLDKDGGRARARFSSRPDVEPFFQDVRDGILRNVSMEARIFAAEEVTKKGEDTPHFLATDWEPQSVAFVAVGADREAQALSEQAERFPCQITLSAEADDAEARMEDTMKVRLLSNDEVIEIGEEEFDEKLHSKDISPKTPQKDPGPKKDDDRDVKLDDRSEDRRLSDIKEADTKRAARIRELMLHFEMDEVWAQRHIKLGSTVDVASADARRILADKAPDIDGKLAFGNDYESLGWKVERMSEALAARAMQERGKKTECPEPAKRYENKSIAECAFALLETLGMTRGRALDPLRAPESVVKLAMGTPDFPGILANVLNKTLLPEYENAMPTYRMIAQQRQFRDYRPHRFVRAGDFPLTQEVGEGGEITEGPMGESSETVTALKYGRILNILWEVLVNDDVGAFQDFGGMVARRIVDRENALFYAICINAASGLGPDLSDGVAVHNATHGNVNTTGALDNDRLNEAFGLMAAQESIDGLKLNVSPRFVLTSPTSHVLARTLLASINPTQASEVNPFAGIMEPIFDANLSGTRYYVLADPSRLPNFIYGTLDGRGPRFEVRQGFEVEGIQVKAVHDFGTGAIDYRGSVTGDGTP